MEKVHHIKSVQKLPVPLEKAWAFFSNPANLAAITPPFLNLKITNRIYGDEIYPGQIITYKVKPVLNIPVFWMTEITHVEPGKLFVDEQRKGPYKLWHHQHHFKPVEGGVEMTDIVHYSLPFGPLGSVAHALGVKGKLKDIFSYRYFKVIELFGDWPGGSEMRLYIK
ncbi:MAG TPA: SRPBCC family protein [Chitinophagaceae bacterium]|jgi:ligand-binding SRPBCC domain-containing protein|nr:SRPBCC family protein [Chitinophagaceae bacterium]